MILFIDLYQEGGKKKVAVSRFFDKNSNGL
jgi:hypothetical protein